MYALYYIKSRSSFFKRLLRTTHYNLFYEAHKNIMNSINMYYCASISKVGNQNEKFATFLLVNLGLLREKKRFVLLGRIFQGKASKHD